MVNQINLLNERIPKTEHIAEKKLNNNKKISKNKSSENKVKTNAKTIDTPRVGVFLIDILRVRYKRKQNSGIATI